MNLVYVLGEYPSATETFIQREMDALRARGVTLGVCALRGPGDAAPAPGVALPPGAVRRGAACLWRRHAARPVDLLRAWKHLPDALRCARAARRQGAQHIHAHFAWITADVAAAAADILGLRFSISAHAWDIYAQPAASLAARLRGAAFVAACTEHGRARLAATLSIGAGRAPSPPLFVAHHGVTPADFAPAGAAANRILAVGRLVEKKGFASLIDACALCRAEQPDLRCLIVGDGPLRAALQARIDAAGLDGVVTLAGALSGAEIAARMADATLLVAPSVEAADGDRDGLPNVILEAMACGLPVIATTACAAGEAVEGGVHGYLVPPAAPRDLAVKILAVLRDAGWRREAGARAREKVCRDFDISHNVDGLLQRFHMAIAKSPEEPTT